MGFNSIKEILDIAKEKKLTIGEIMLMQEAEGEGVVKDGVFEQMLENWQIMKNSIENGLVNAPHSKSGLVGGDGQKLYQYSKSETLAGHKINRAVSYALATAEVNASMGRIVACPTAGSCGIVPAVLKSV